MSAGRQRRFNGCALHRRAAWTFGLLLASLALLPADSAQAITIQSNFSGGAAPTSISGSGDLTTIFNTAASWWESAIQDDYTVTLLYSWAPLSGSLSAHSLAAQGGDPNRETIGFIRFDNDSSTRWFLDPTPAGSNEWTTYNTQEQDLGGGAINTGRWYSDFTGPSVDGVTPYDLLSVAIHEIGHALGMSSSNSSYKEQVWPDNVVEVTDPRPLAGTQIQFSNGSTPASSSTSNPHTSTTQLPNSLMRQSVSAGTRRLLDGASILAAAELSQFTDLNLNPRVLLPGDTDGDGDIDTVDLSVAIANFTGAGQGDKSSEEGDIDGDGDVDTHDITSSFLNFTGALASPAVNPDLIYDPASGNVRIATDGTSILSFNLKSSALTDSPADFSDLDGDIGAISLLVDNTDGTIGWVSAAALAGIGFDGALGETDTAYADLGNILPAGLDLAGLEALLASYAWAGSGGTGGSFDLTVVPEPTSLLLLVLGLMALAAVRRITTGRLS